MFPRKIFSNGRLLFAVLAAVIIIVCLGWRQRSQQTTTADTQPKIANGTFKPNKDQWTGIRIEEVKSRSFQSMVSTDGYIAFDDDAVTPVFSAHSGRVSRVIAKLGDMVKKGAPLMAVDSTEIVQGQNDVATAKANLGIARANEKRQHALFEAGAGAEKDWRQSQSDLVTAEANWNSARGRLRILGDSETEIDALAAMPAHYAEALVLAPIGGIVTQRQVGIGQYIASAINGESAPVYTIADLSKDWLVANVRESDAPFLRLGQPVEVKVLAMPERAFKATIAWISPSVDPVTHRLAVRAEIPNPDGFLKPGMSASFSIATSVPKASPAVPENAVIYEGDAARVLVADGDGGIAIRQVHVGRTLDGFVEVVDGLHAGDKVVTAGTIFIDQAVQKH